MHDPQCFRDEALRQNDSAIPMQPIIKAHYRKIIENARFVMGDIAASGED